MNDNMQGAYVSLSYDGMTQQVPRVLLSPLQNRRGRPRDEHILALTAGFVKGLTGGLRAHTMKRKTR